MCLRKHPRSWVSLFLPLKASPLPFRFIPFWGTAPSWGALGACTLRKEASAGDPSTSGPGGGWLFQGPRGQRVSPPSLGCTGVYGPSQGKPDGTCWRGASVKGTRPDCLDPSPPTHGTQACSRSRGWKAAQVREMGGNKTDIALFFSLISRGCYIGLHLICSVVPVVSGQAPVSVMTFTYSISVLQVFAIEIIEQGQVTSLGWILCPSDVYLFWVYATPRTITCYVLLSMEFSRHKYWSR